MNVTSQYSGHPGQPVGGAVMFPTQPFMTGPVADMAVQYGHTLAGQGTEFVHKNVSTEYWSWFVLMACLINKSINKVLSKPHGL